jgi:CheY-like chemotaxis protein
MATRPPPKPFLKKPIHARSPLPKPLILCIEDDPIYLTLRKGVLEKEGYNVIGVTSAAEALKALREAPVCCTIADHMLQGQTGTQLAQEMKAIKSDVPVILFSGTNPATLQGTDVFVNKGETTARFLEIVRDVVERFCGIPKETPSLLPSDTGSKLAEVLQFPNAPEESHVSHWLKLGDNALDHCVRKRK